jgi:uncharacterized membrane protein
MNSINLIVFSKIGFAISFYIYYSKINDKELFCMNKKDCDYVVKSKYGKTFGVDNTIYGMLYYSGMFLMGILIFLNHNIFKQLAVYYSIVGVSLVTVFFSLRLIYIQAFILKKWCYYCIASAIISILILITLVL